MNRIVKIILILIAAFFLILGIIWLIGRNKDIKNGAQPLTFRQFLGLSTKKNPTQTVPGEGSSGFTPNGDGTSSGTGANGAGSGDNSNGLNGLGNLNSLNNVNVSQFTNGVLNPGGFNTGSLPQGSGSNSGTAGDTGTTGSGANGTAGSGDTSPGNSNAGSQPVCSDDDTNIPFTQEQLAQLTILQNRFYTIAQTLHNDTDVETEVANHDAFKTKADSIFELYAYCESKLPLINADASNDSRLTLHVATPFWRSWYDEVGATIPSDVTARIKAITGTTLISDPAQDSLSFLVYDGYAKEHTTGVHDNMGNGKGDNPEGDLPNADVDQLLPGVTRIHGPYGLVNFSKPSLVPTTGSALGDMVIIEPVVEKFLRLNLW